MAGINSFFDEQRVVERHPIIELKSIYPVDPIRDIPVGDVTNTGSEYKVTAAAITAHPEKVTQNEILHR